MNKSIKLSLLVAATVILGTVGIAFQSGKLSLFSDKKHSSSKNTDYQKSSSAAVVAAIPSASQVLHSGSSARLHPGVESKRPTAQTDRTQRVERADKSFLANGKLIASRDSIPDTQGHFERVKIVKTNFKYPLIRVQQTIAKDAATGKESVIKQVEMVADHMVVKLDKGISEAKLKQLNQKYGTSILRKMFAPNTYLVALNGKDIDALPLAVAKYTQEESVVTYAEPDYILYPVGIPNDEDFAYLWGMNNTGQFGGTTDKDIDAPEAWNIHTGTSAVKVGVIDTGIDYNHPDLAANIWTNPGEIASNGTDDDGNGFIDDVRGWNFYDDNSDPMDLHYHGTHCAGTIGGVGNNGIGVAGVCWNVQIVPIKFLGPEGGTTSDGIDSIYYASSVGVHLTSNSWGGGPFSPAMRGAIEDANSKGILFIAAAGNDSLNADINPMYPAAYDNANIISVAATDDFDDLASFSNYGATSVDLGAPGWAIYSTVPPATTGLTNGFLSGTSMAAPHVSGACALIKSYAPSLTHSAIKGYIISSVDPAASLSGKCVTGGRLNVHQALLAVPPPADTTPPTVGITSPSEGSTISGTISVSANASDDVGVVGVQFKVDGSDSGSEDTAAPYSISLNTAALSAGAHTLTAVARDAAGNSTTSATVNVTVSNIPAAPSNLTASTVSSTEAGLAWVDNSSNESEFKIERKTGSAGTYAQIAVVAANVTTYADAGLTAGTQYFYRVRASNASGDSAFSNEASFGGTPSIPTAGLILWLDSSDLSGNVWPDRTGLSGNGVATNVVKDGEGAAYFNGSSSLVTVARNHSPNTFTLSVWAKKATPFSRFEEGLLSCGIDGSFFIDYEGSSQDNAFWAYRVFTTAGWYPITLTGVPFSTNWFHFCVVYDGTKFRGYANGVLHTEIPATGSVLYSSPNYVLGQRQPGKPFFNGSIKEALIYNRALTPAEVQQIYTRTPVPPPTPAPVPPTAGLIGRWSFDGNANDSSGNGRHGTVNGAALTAGKFGQAYSFDGNDGINVGNLDFSSGNYSVSTWIKTTTPAVVDDYRNWIAKVDGSGGPFMVEIGDGRNLPGSGYHGPHYIVWNGGTTTVNIEDRTKNIRDGNWHMVTVTYQNGAQKLYLNGVGVAASSFSGVLPSNPASVIIGGSDYGPYHHPWKGEIDEVLIYNRPLSEAEVQQLYGATPAPIVPPASLVGHWSFDGDANDSSGNGRHGTVNGATLTAGKFGQAYSFDGNDHINVGNISPTSGVYTVSGWIRTGAAPVIDDYRTWIDKMDSSGGPYMLGIGDGRDLPGSAKNGPQYLVWNGGSTVVNLENRSVNIRDNNWHMFSVTYDFGIQKLYIDGVQVALANFVGALPSNAANVLIGGGTSFSFYHQPWKGEIDEVVIYNRALSTTEIQQLYGVISPNNPPSVALTAPADGSTYTEPASVAISADASDSDGTVSKVEFFNGATKLGEDTSSPYSMTWTNVTAGTYTLTAVATDDDSATTTSSSRAITVVLPPPAAPSGLVASAVFSSQITLGWSDNSSAETGFKIQRKQGSGGTYVQIASVGANVTSYADTGLVTGTQYFYRVCASNAGGDSAFSNEASATVGTPAPIPTAGLILWLNSADLSGNTWVDRTGLSGNGVANNVTKDVDGSAFFNGANSLVTVPRNHSPNTFTLSVWAKKATTFSQFEEGLLSCGIDGSFFIDYEGSSQHNAFWAYRVFTTDGWYPITMTGVPFATQWFHFCVTYDGAKFRGYANGVLHTEVPATGSVLYSSPNYVLGQRQPGKPFFHGNMKEVLIYNRALSTAEVQTLAGIGGSTPIFGALAAGPNHSVALKDNGTVWTWGYNKNGELGLGVSDTNTHPLAVANGVSNAVEITTGGSHSLALRADGRLIAWGYNNNGQLGDGTTTKRPSPILLSTISNVSTFAAGAYHTVALKTDGTVWTWGQGTYGQRGDGTVIKTQKTPVKVGFSNCIAVAAGQYHSVALKSDGTVWTWGQNKYGQLGNNTTNNASVPVNVTGLNGIIDIAAGDSHTLALHSNGTVWAWGYNNTGRLGDGTTTNRWTPVLAKNLTGVAAIDGGGAHSLALKSDGTVWTWGVNSSGQLGVGSTSKKLVPTKVTAITNVLSLSGGGKHSLFLRSDGTVYSSGLNTSGQLGDGTLLLRNAPVQVIGVDLIAP